MIPAHTQKKKEISPFAKQNMKKKKTGRYHCKNSSLICKERERKKLKKENRKINFGVLLPSLDSKEKEFEKEKKKEWKDEKKEDVYPH